MKQKLPDNLKRKRINILLNDEERQIIMQNSKKYGVGRNLAEYVRYVCLDPNIYIEDLKGRQEIIDKISEYLAETRETKYHIKKLFMSVNFPKEDIKMLGLKIENLSFNLDTLKKFIGSTLSYSYAKKIQQEVKDESK